MCRPSLCMLVCLYMPNRTFVQKCIRCDHHLLIFDIPRHGTASLLVPACFMALQTRYPLKVIGSTRLSNRIEVSRLVVYHSAVKGRTIKVRTGLGVLPNKSCGFRVNPPENFKFQVTEYFRRVWAKYIYLFFKLLKARFKFTKT